MSKSRQITVVIDKIIIFNPDNETAKGFNMDTCVVNVLLD